MAFKEMNDHQLVVIDKDGNEVLLEILFTYEHEERGKKYVFFYEKSNPEEIMVAEYTDEGDLFEIEDEEEYAEVEEVFNAFLEETESEEEEDEGPLQEDD